MSPATIKATNEPVPSNNVCTSHSPVVCIHVQNIPGPKNYKFHSKVFFTIKENFHCRKNFLLYGISGNTVALCDLIPTSKLADGNNTVISQLKLTLAAS